MMERTLDFNPRRKVRNEPAKNYCLLKTIQDYQNLFKDGVEVFKNQPNNMDVDF